MATARRILWSLPAENDLDDIWSYLAQTSPDLADRQLRDIAGASKVLATWPLTGRLRVELQPNVRSLTARPYVIFYRVSEDSIEVIRVLHSRRDIDAIFGGGS